MSYCPCGQVVVAPGEECEPGFPGGGGVGFAGPDGAAGVPGVRLADGPGEGCFGTAPHPSRNRHTNSEAKIAIDFNTRLPLSCEAVVGEFDQVDRDVEDLRVRLSGQFPLEPLPRRLRPSLWTTATVWI